MALFFVFYRFVVQNFGFHECLKAIHNLPSQQSHIEIIINESMSAEFKSGQDLRFKYGPFRSGRLSGQVRSC